MISPALAVAVSAGYLLLLFAVAAFADRRAALGRSVIGNAWIYSLSLAVYCTAWTYFGSVGRAATGGIWFLPIYLGPTLAMILAPIVVRKMIVIARAYRITSVADFVASRYGKSPGLAALVTLICVVGILPYIALQIKAISAGFLILTGDPGVGAGTGLRPDGTLLVTLVLAAFTIVFGTRHLDSAERHEGMVAAIAAESLVKLAAFLAVGAFVTWGLFDGMADIWARAAALPELADLLRLGDGTGGGPLGDGGAWLGLMVLAGLSVLLLPRQFQVMVVECVDPAHVNRAAWVFPAYLLAINLFVLPVALGGLLLLGTGTDPETFVLSLPLAHGAPGLALFAYVGGLSAATGMLIVETIAVSTMVCNDLVMPALLRRGLGTRGDPRRLLLGIRRAAILGILLLGYLYFRVAGDAYALVSIGLISFAAVAQVAPALFGGLYWRGGTALGAAGGLLGGFAVWAWTLMLPSIAKSGWIDGRFVTDGPFGIALLAPEALFGLAGFHPLTHALFWSLLVNIALYVGLSLWRAPSGREASQALLFVEAGTGAEHATPVFWRGRARLGDLMDLARRLLGPERARAVFEEHAEEAGVPVDAIVPDARLVDRVERQIAGAVGTASARVMVASVADEEPLGVDDVMAILDEASQARRHAREVEAFSEELAAANAALKSLDEMKDDFIASVTHELRTPLTSIRALSEIMLDDPDLPPEQRREFLGIVVAETERLGRLVNQVLDLAKLESGGADWRTEAVDLRAVVAGAVQATAALFAEKGATVETRLPAAVPPVQADRDRLTQVMLNLLSNAAKFVPVPGGRVEIRLTEEPGWLVVAVEDNGPGVPAEDRETVFEKFRQAGTPDARKPGTGLGLPISRQIVDHLGGRMWLDSRPGGGACFAFRLPVPPNDKNDAEENHGRQGADR